MPITVTVPGVGRVTFPDGMTEAQISEAITQMTPPAPPEGARALQPSHDAPDVKFSASEPEHAQEPFSLARFLWPHRAGLLFAFALVIVATAANQAGQRLLAWAIDHGITPDPIALQDHFGIAMAAKLCAARFKLGSNFEEVIDLAVEHNPASTICGTHRLVTGG